MRNMALDHDSTTRTRTAARPAADEAAPAAGSTTFGRAAAVLRLLLSVTFLWAFFDKAFGWGYATPAGRAWTEGGSPTKGFLSGVAAGPLQSTFHSMAGQTWADWAFMLGLLGIGLALAAGVGLRVTAVAGAVMMALMWAAEWPPAQHLSDGTPSMSTNPLIDYHVLYAAALIVLAVASAGRTWGLGRIWERLPFVARHRWLL